MFLAFVCRRMGCLSKSMVLVAVFHLLNLAIIVWFLRGDFFECIS